MKISLKDFLKVLPTLEKQVNAAIQQELVAIAPAIVETAQDKIGEYQDGWPSLADATQKRRERLGYTPDDPLLREGDLRNSYEAIVTDHHITIGSSDPKAEYVEIGTATVPPRPVTLPSVYENLDALREKLGEAAVQGLSNKVEL